MAKHHNAHRQPPLRAVNRSISRAALCLFFSLLVSCGGSSERGNTNPANTKTLSQLNGLTTSSVLNLTYLPSDENFPNPERGVYISYQPSGSANPVNTAPIRTPGVLDYFGRERDRTGATTIRAVYLLADSRTSDISANFLARLDDDFAAIREAGFKLIPYFAYNWPTDETGAQDASAAQIQRHLAQLQPVFIKNKDVMPAVIAGLIGAWGEWHDSSNQNIGVNGPNSNTQLILKALLDAVPRERMIVLRYVSDKQTLFGTQPIGASQAFDQSDKSRLGFHNECFMSDRYGEQFRAQFHDYLKVEGLYVPHMAALDVDCLSPGQIVPWDDLIAEAQIIGLDHMSDPPDLSRLGGTSRLLELYKRLGYRFRLTQASVPSSVRAGETFTANMTITNDGFSALYNAHQMKLILRHTTQGVKHIINIDGDPRLSQPGSTNTVSVSATLPSNLPAGNYEVLLHIADADSSLSARPEYSIRLANQAVWEQSTGYNLLFNALQISN
jgi:Domain of unknown function (DUF4874)/Domain of unknown function (DUF4832)